MPPIEDKLKSLPPNLQQEVERFIDHLIDGIQEKPAQHLTQDWAGHLKSHRQSFTALELQKKALEWRKS